MARNAALEQRSRAVELLLAGLFTEVQIATLCSVSVRSIQRYKRNIRTFGAATAPHVVRGPLRVIDPRALSALLAALIHRPSMYLDEMAVFLYDHSGITVSISTIHRALSSIGWSRKATRKIATQRCEALRDAHTVVLSGFHAGQLVFVDESGCDERVGIRKTSWSPRGTTPEDVVNYDRGERINVLPAYTVNGVITADIYAGYTDEERFNTWIEERVLPLCMPFLGPNSVLIMDNASFHRSYKITELCNNAGVKLIYLPPYSPDFNSIEEFFGQLKAVVRRH